MKKTLKKIADYIQITWMLVIGQIDYLNDAWRETHEFNLNVNPKKSALGSTGFILLYSAFTSIVLGVYFYGAFVIFRSIIASDNIAGMLAGGLLLVSTMTFIPICLIMHGCTIFRDEPYIRFVRDVRKLTEAYGCPIQKLAAGDPSINHLTLPECLIKLAAKIKMLEEKGKPGLEEKAILRERIKVGNNFKLLNENEHTPTYFYTEATRQLNDSRKAVPQQV